MDVVEFSHATVTVGGRTVLSRISIAIKPDEFIGVLGPNGAGKTTLMRTILGLIVPAAGSAHVFGEPPRRGNPAIGYVPQVRSIRPDLRMRGLLLAQALLGTPRLLLLDEPLISLDSRRQEEVIDLVRRFSRERGITVMFSAHELNQLLGALDRVLYLGSDMAVTGTVEEVVTAPVLSRLYGADIDVVRASGHVFVVSRGDHVERIDHSHDNEHPHCHA